jgi:hypothetical protein
MGPLGGVTSMHELGGELGERARGAADGLGPHVIDTTAMSPCDIYLRRTGVGGPGVSGTRSCEHRDTAP